MSARNNHHAEPIESGVAPEFLAPSAGSTPADPIIIGPDQIDALYQRERERRLQEFQHDFPEFLARYKARAEIVMIPQGSGIVRAELHWIID